MDVFSSGKQPIGVSQGSYEPVIVSPTPKETTIDNIEGAL